MGFRAPKNCIWPIRAGKFSGVRSEEFLDGVISHSTVPSIGASGGISGLITFYALEFPRERLGFLNGYYWRLTWVQIPAWAVFLLWLALQIFGSYEQFTGFSSVSSLAHLGGCGAGFLLWLWWRKRTSGRATLG